MPAIEWDPSLETGDELVDRQHRDIHALYNELEQSDDDPSRIMDVLGKLMGHVDEHFACEEDLMRRVDYPAAEADAHVAEHRRMADRARAAVLAFRAGELTRTGPLVDFLREWLADHVNDHDRDFVDYMRAHRGLPEGTIGAS